MDHTNRYRYKSANCLAKNRTTAYDESDGQNVIPLAAAPAGTGGVRADETLLPILIERDSSRLIPRNGAGAHSRFGHQAMIGSDHRVFVSLQPRARVERGGKFFYFFLP